MKKSILALLFAAAVVTVAVIACDKEDSDFDKGKKDGKAVCDCALAAMARQDEDAFEDCMLKVDLNKVAAENAEYIRGLQEGAAACEELFGSMEDPGQSEASN